MVRHTLSEVRSLNSSFHESLLSASYGWVIHQSIFVNRVFTTIHGKMKKDLSLMGARNPNFSKMLTRLEVSFTVLPSKCSKAVVLKEFPVGFLEMFEPHYQKIITFFSMRLFQRFTLKLW